MASRHEYRYSFKMGKEQDMNPDLVDKSDLVNGLKGFAFEIRINYTVRTRLVWLEEVVVEEYIDSETKEAFTYVHRDDQTRDESMLAYMTSEWMEECWMNGQQIRDFVVSALEFARSLEARPENASLSLIPVVVDFWICTVQQQNESIDEARESAVRSASRLQAAAASCSSFPSPSHPPCALLA